MGKKANVKKKRKVWLSFGRSYKLQVNNSGFTLLELLIAIAIIGVLAGFFITTFPAVQRRARDAERRSDIKQYQTAMEAFANRNNGNYPVVSGVIGTSVLCDALGVPDCPNDAQNSYNVISNATAYSLWAALEQPPSPVTYFVVCSNGRSFETTTQPDATTPCP